MVAQSDQLPIDIPHRDLQVKPAIFDLLGCNPHRQPLHPFLGQCRLHLHIHDHRREPHAPARVRFGLDVLALFGLPRGVALAGCLKQLAQFRRGEEFMEGILEMTLSDSCVDLKKEGGGADYRKRVHNVRKRSLGDALPTRQPRPHIQHPGRQWALAG